MQIYGKEVHLAPAKIERLDVPVPDMALIAPDLIKCSARFVRMHDVEVNARLSLASEYRIGAELATA